MLEIDKHDMGTMKLYVWLSLISPWRLLAPMARGEAKIASNGVSAFSYLLLDFTGRCIFFCFFPGLIIQR